MDVNAAVFCKFGQFEFVANKAVYHASSPVETGQSYKTVFGTASQNDTELL